MRRRVAWLWILALLLQATPRVHAQCQFQRDAIAAKQAELDAEQRKLDQLREKLGRLIQLRDRAEQFKDHVFYEWCANEAAADAAYLAVQKAEGWLEICRGALAVADMALQRLEAQIKSEEATIKELEANIAKLRAAKAKAEKELEGLSNQLAEELRKHPPNEEVIGRIRSAIIETQHEIWSCEAAMRENERQIEVEENILLGLELGLPLARLAKDKAEEAMVYAKAALEVAKKEYEEAKKLAAYSWKTYLQALDTWNDLRMRVADCEIEITESEGRIAALQSELDALLAEVCEPRRYWVPGTSLGDGDWRIDPTWCETHGSPF
ncbi:MAG: hypothetical protein NTX53_03005 [candidate division WOR-3 bacterium]|nr:hypothetical protein [candidate division WOR-3 bacterium]